MKKTKVAKIAGKIFIALIIPAIILVSLSCSGMAFESNYGQQGFGKYIYTSDTAYAEAGLYINTGKDVLVGDEIAFIYGGAKIEGERNIDLFDGMKDSVKKYGRTNEFITGKVTSIDGGVIGTDTPYSTTQDLVLGTASQDSAFLPGFVSTTCVVVTWIVLAIMFVCIFIDLLFGERKKNPEAEEKARKKAEAKEKAKQSARTAEVEKAEKIQAKAKEKEESERKMAEEKALSNQKSAQEAMEKEERSKVAAAATAMALAKKKEEEEAKAKAEQERIAKEKAEAAAKAKAEQERIAKEKAEAAAKAKAEQERIAKEKADAKQAAKEEKARQKEEKAEAKKAAKIAAAAAAAAAALALAKKKEEEEARKQAEKEEQERLAAEKEAERKAEAERLAAERAEVERKTREAEEARLAAIAAAVAAKEAERKAREEAEAAERKAREEAEAAERERIAKEAEEARLREEEYKKEREKKFQETLIALEATAKADDERRRLEAEKFEGKYINTEIDDIEDEELEFNLSNFDRLVTAENEISMITKAEILKYVNGIVQNEFPTKAQNPRSEETTLFVGNMEYAFIKQFDKTIGMLVNLPVEYAKTVVDYGVAESVVVDKRNWFRWVIKENSTTEEVINIISSSYYFACYKMRKQNEKEKLGK